MIATPRRKPAPTTRKLQPVQELLVEIAIALHATVAVRRLPERKRKARAATLAR